MRILIVGATSAIAQATARRYAAAGARLFLVARDSSGLEAVAQDLRVRGADAVDTRVMEAEQFDRHGAVVAEAFGRHGGLDLALIAHGVLPDQRACESSFERTRHAIEVNFLSAVSLLTPLATLLERQGRGSLAVITSVAGDRGRQGNYVYGAAKAGLGVFLQGLRSRLQGSGVHVLTIKPGFVATPMTAHLPKGALWAEPEAVARGICNAVRARRDVVYLPWFWRPLMAGIRSIPEPLFKRMRL